MEKFDAYSDVLARLVEETVRCCPAEWTYGVLSIESDGSRINYSLKNSEESSKASISEKLRDLIDEFYVKMAQGGDVWIGAQVKWRRDGADLKFDTSFQYPPRAAPQ